MKRGFTLVELSIVLIIIGLLIGGILVAQSMISTVNIQSLARQISQFDIAVNNFRTKYNGLPGDTRAFPNPGDGDGKIENSETNTGAYGNTSRVYDFEYANFWPHLSVSGFAPDNIIYSNTALTGVRAGVQIPFATYGKGTTGNRTGVIFHHNPWAIGPYYYFCDFSTSTTQDTELAAATAFAYNPTEMLALDSKIDDGIARQSDMTTYRGIMWQAWLSGQQCFNTSTYAFNISVTSKQCCFLVSILGRQEDLP